MVRFYKIFLVWMAVMLLYAVCLAYLPHKEISSPSVANKAIFSLLFFISSLLFNKEPSKKNKFIFLNFSLFFSLIFFAFAYEFFGTALFVNIKYASHFYYQYYLAAYILFLSIAIVYLVIDVMFYSFRTYQKYLATFSIVMFFFVWYFHPIFLNPMYLYSTEEIHQWKTLSSYVESNPDITTVDQIAKHVNVQSWRDGFAVGDLYQDENMKRIDELLPYLEGDNYLTLITQPLHSMMISMNVMVVGFILLFFGYQYKKDPPQGAYIDKIIFVFLLFVSTEILHQWGYIHSVEWKSLTELFSIGQYITIFMLLIMVVFFALRLSFISSITGEYYESELARNPQRVSRLRDMIDEIILTKFFNIKPFRGRIFESLTSKKANS